MALNQIPVISVGKTPYSNLNICAEPEQQMNIIIFLMGI